VAAIATIIIVNKLLYNRWYLFGGSGALTLCP